VLIRYLAFSSVEWVFLENGEVGKLALFQAAECSWILLQPISTVPSSHTLIGSHEVPTVTYAVETEQDSFELALKRQANRRSLTDAEIFQCMETISDRYGNPPNGGLSYSVQEMADKLGISKRKAEMALRVMEQSSSETKRRVKTGVASIHKAEKAFKTLSTESPPSSEKRKKQSRQSRTVEIDPDQWEQLERLSELTDADIEDIVYQALEIYLTPHETEEQAAEEEGESEAAC
jgi:hypothetical protein